MWDHSTYSKNRDRLLEADIARTFLKGILEHTEVKPLLSDDHFTVDGALIHAWASLRSFVPKADTPDGGGAPPASPGGRRRGIAKSRTGSSHEQGQHSAQQDPKQH